MSSVAQAYETIPVAELPAGQTRRYESVFDELLKIPIGTALKVPVEPGDTAKIACQNLRQLAKRRGVGFGSRTVGGALYIFQVPALNRVSAEIPEAVIPLREELIKRRRQIWFSFLQTGSQAKTADKFGISRQRVEQLVHDFQFENNDFVKPYLAAIPETGSMKCAFCGEAKSTRRPLCSPCQKRRTVISNIISRLRAHREGKNGPTSQRTSKHYVNTAAYLIRKHDVKPEELARFV